ncbi:MAG TPA: antibiotic biosynthesis monooxygenase [Thermoanaerobaculia bacterium]
MQAIEEAHEETTSIAPTCRFVAMSRFTVANGMEAEVRQAFRDRPHLVDDVPGFVRMEVLSPVDDPREIWLLTYWSDERSFQSWHRGHLHHEAHKGIPKGLKLVPKSTVIRYFDYICS